MTLTITWAMIAWAIGLFLAWNGFLIGVIRWLLSREVSRFETRLTDAEGKAAKAVSAASEFKQTMADALAQEKQLFIEQLGQLRLEFAGHSVCGNHDRMEQNDNKLFGRLDQLHGDVRELLGGVKALANSVELLNTHHLNGGK